MGSCEPEKNEACFKRGSLVRPLVRSFIRLPALLCKLILPCVCSYVCMYMGMCVCAYVRTPVCMLCCVFQHVREYSCPCFAPERDSVLCVCIQLRYEHLIRLQPVERVRTAAPTGGGAANLHNETRVLQMPGIDSRKACCACIGWSSTGNWTRK